MKRIDKLIGTNEEFSIETRLFHITVLTLFAGAALWGLQILVWEFSAIEFAFCVFTASVWFLMYYLSRYHGFNYISKLVFLITGYLVVIPHWIYMWGPDEVSLLFLSILVWQVLLIKKYHGVWLSANILLYGAVLYVVDNHPGLITWQRMFNTNYLFEIYLGYCVFAIVIYALLRTVIQNLRRQTDKREVENFKLKEINHEMNKLIETKDRLISVFSHDLKSPLNGITGLSEQALDNENLDPAKLRKYLKNINHSSRYIHALLENILSWIRLQTDSLQPRSEYISIEELVRENLQLFDLVVRQKELDIVVDMPGSLCIYADREMTESIFRNLLSNAIKFSYRGKKILISAFLDADLHEVELSVRDYGVGMNERQIQNFRDARLWNSTSGTEKEKGTGLGLIISKEFAIANEGSIELDSNKNRGTEVKLRMPANVKKEMTEECLT